MRTYAIIFCGKMVEKVVDIVRKTWYDKRGYIYNKKINGIKKEVRGLLK